MCRDFWVCRAWQMPASPKSLLIHMEGQKGIAHLIPILIIGIIVAVCGWIYFSDDGQDMLSRKARRIFNLETSVNEGSAAPTIAPSILKVASPNGGESLKSGSSLPIRWQFLKAPGNNVKCIQILVLKAGVTLGRISEKVCYPIYNQVQWEVGKYYSNGYNKVGPGNNYKIGAVLLDNNGGQIWNAQDTSDSNFEIYLTEKPEVPRSY